MYNQFIMYALGSGFLIGCILCFYPSRESWSMYQTAFSMASVVFICCLYVLISLVLGMVFVSFLSPDIMYPMIISVGNWVVGSVLMMVGMTVAVVSMLK